MPKNFNFLFYYLEKENITIDKTEFEIQIKSNPNYPSLLTITDTLSFFNIDNGMLQVEILEIPSLPDRFVALLAEENSQPQLCFIEKKGDNYFYTSDDKETSITITTLESRWKNLVLLICKN